MSVHVSSWVWKESKASGTELLIMLALADAADHDGQCWPSLKQLSRMCRCSESSVPVAIKNAVERGELAVSHSVHKNGSAANNMYQFPAFQGTLENGVGTPLTGVGTPLDTPPSILKEPSYNRHIKDGAVSAKPTKAELSFFVTSLGLPETDADDIWDRWLANGFRTKTGPIKDWQADVRTKKRNGWLPSLQPRNGNGHTKPEFVVDCLGRRVLNRA